MEIKNLISTKRRKILLASIIILAIACSVVWASSPAITSNIVHVTATSNPECVAHLSVIKEGDMIPTNLTTKAFAAPSPSNPYGLWTPTAVANGTFYHNTVGNTFDVNFTGTVPLAGTEYSLIYYADPYGSGLNEFLASAVSNNTGYLVIPTTHVALGVSLPKAGDANFNQTGAKVFLVTSADYDVPTHNMTLWNPDNYLFETELVHYYFAPVTPDTVDLWGTITTPTPAPALGSQVPNCTIHFWYSTDGLAVINPAKVWTELPPAIQTTWGLYGGFAGTKQYTFLGLAEVDFGLTVEQASGLNITITPPYPQP